MRDEIPPSDEEGQELEHGWFQDGAWRDDPGSARRRSRQKRRLVELALERGKTMIRLDPRRPGCVVPAQLSTEPQLALNLSWRFPDTRMVVNERGVAATLRFGGVASRVAVPWHALWALAAPDADELRLWPLDVPEELGGPPRSWEGVVAPPVEPRRPSLSVVGDAPHGAAAGHDSAAFEREPTAPAQPSAPEPPAPDPLVAAPKSPPPPRPPWLRLVK